MSHSDPISDMLARMRNAMQVSHATVRVPSSNVKKAILTVFKDEGYIRGFSEVKNEQGFNEIVVELKYANNKPVIQEMTRVSKPSRRVYSQIKELPRVKSGLGIFVLSTSKGILSDNAARAQNVGGEIICKVF